MKKGYLSQYFNGVAVKILSAVESDTITSNQHEFNGVKDLKSILGEPKGKSSFRAKFLYVTDVEDNLIQDDGFLTWYDAREKAREERNVNRSEYRLYFSTNSVMQLARMGDFLFICRLNNDLLLTIVAENGTTIAQQLAWLFGFHNFSKIGFLVRDELDKEGDRLEYTSRLILESIGLSTELTNQSFLADLLTKFPDGFPPTKVFSKYAVGTLSNTIMDCDFDDDDLLMKCLEREEILFRTLENYLIKQRLSDEFKDVDEFIAYSLSVHNRRKSRAGLSLENHLETIFSNKKIFYTRNPTTENKSKPDFIFPSINKYKDDKYDVACLTMLGVKSTCKDRWRQILSEAEKINQKHLLSIEPAISTNQTNEMKIKKVQLIIPKSLHNTYAEHQQGWLMSVSEFTGMLLDKQKSINR